MEKKFQLWTMEEGHDTIHDDTIAFVRVWYLWYFGVFNGIGQSEKRYRTARSLVWTLGQSKTCESTYGGAVIVNGLHLASRST